MIVLYANFVPNFFRADRLKFSYMDVTMLFSPIPKVIDLSNKSTNEMELFYRFLFWSLWTLHCGKYFVSSLIEAFNPVSTKSLPYLSKQILLVSLTMNSLPLHSISGLYFPTHFFKNQSFWLRLWYVPNIPWNPFLINGFSSPFLQKLEVVTPLWRLPDHPKIIQTTR